MKIEQFYRSDRATNKLLPGDKAMGLIEKHDRVKLEVSQLRKKVSDGSNIDFDDQKSPSVKYNKKIYDEFRKKSSQLRLLKDKIISLDTEIQKLSPDCGSPSEADWYQREIVVLEVTLDTKLDFFKDRMLKKKRHNIAACVRAGEGDIKRGLIAESARLQEEVSAIEDLKKKYAIYKEHEEEILKIIDQICGE